MYFYQCSTSLAIGKTQMESMLRSNLTLVRRAVIRNEDNKCWAGVQEREPFPPSVGV